MEPIRSDKLGLDRRARAYPKQKSRISPSVQKAWIESCLSSSSPVQVPWYKTDVNCDSIFIVYPYYSISNIAVTCYYVHGTNVMDMGTLAILAIRWKNRKETNDSHADIYLFL